LKSPATDPQIIDDYDILDSMVTDIKIHLHILHYFVLVSCADWSSFTSQSRLCRIVWLCVAMFKYISCLGKILRPYILMFLYCIRKKRSIICNLKDQWLQGA
jgi:hypothetical protein